MATLNPDLRIKFNETVKLSKAGGIITADVFGGPLLRMQVAIFNAQDRLIGGVGTDGLGIPVTSEKGGTASWLFEPPADASYIKWGVQAFRLSAGFGQYSVSVKVRDHNGDTLVTGRFGAKIPDGEFFDDIIFDGVDVAVVDETAMPSILAGAKP
jgi:hypothetical protein